MLRSLAILAAAGLAGCTNFSTSNVAVTDRTVFLPSGRIGIDISPKAEAPSRPHTGHGLELGLSGGSGDDTQTLNPGAPPIQFGAQTFNAPNQLRHEFDWRFAEVAYRYRRFFGTGEFGIEALGGVAYAELDLTVTSATQRASDTRRNGGVVGAFGMVWKFRPTTSLQPRLTVFGSGKREGVSVATRSDFYVVQVLGQHAAVRAGISGWDLNSDRDDLGASNSRIRARFSGFALGLDLMF